MCCDLTIKQKNRIQTYSDIVVFFARAHTRKMPQTHEFTHFCFIHLCHRVVSLVAAAILLSMLLMMTTMRIINRLDSTNYNGKFTNENRIKCVNV